MALRLIAGILLGTWFLLVLLGKKGFVHTLFMLGISFVVIVIVDAYRQRLKV